MPDKKTNAWVEKTNKARGDNYNLGSAVPVLHNEQKKQGLLLNNFVANRK
jgi:hypothetical protein